MHTIDALQKFLEHKAYQLRVSSLRATTQAGSGHPTSCLSAADLVAALFFYAMHFDPYHPENPNNDRFILSKGHAAPLLYAVWKELGIISDTELLQLRTFDSPLEGHPTPRFSRAEAATGSLGQGLSIGIGMALSARLHNQPYKTYVLLGDMETTEGSIWEAAEIAAFYQLSSVIALIDCNGLGQSTAALDDHDMVHYHAKFTAFGWHAIILDGHTMQEIIQALDAAQTITDKPVVLIAKTRKGYGLEPIEGKQGFHGKAFSKQELPDLLASLQKQFSQAHAYNNQYTWKPHIPLATNPLPTTQSPINSISSYTLGTEIATRKAYGQALVDLGKQVSNVVVLDAEVKNSTYAELFEKHYPERFFQCFIAEQNMVGMGVGFATRGNIPFISTFGAFFSRAYDQVRMAAIGRSPLRLCGSHAGVSIGEDGPSQMALEDIAIMRAIPNSTILYPCDAISTYKLVMRMVQHNDGITYLRTTREATAVMYTATEEFTIGGCKILRHSNNDTACIVAAGITVFEALRAYDILQTQGIAIAIIDAYSIKPLAHTTILDMAQHAHNRVITVEDHYLEGGLGEAVTYALRNNAITIECLAVKKLPRSGTPQELRAYEEINADAIVSTIKHMLSQ